MQQRAAQWDQRYDLLIVGGGMVGATLACALGGSGLSVGVIEPAPFDTSTLPEQFENRVSALTRATQRVFERLGAWEGMVARRVAPYREMTVWDATGSGQIHFGCVELGEPDLGHIVENRVILAALRERMATFDNIELICPAVPATLVLEADEAGVVLEEGRRLGAALVVGADGSGSWVREQAGITSSGWGYDQTAVVATVRTSRPHGATAWQRFMPDGPLAFLPLAAPDHSSIVWSTTPERAAALMELSDSAFLDELQRAFGDRLGRMEAVGPRGAFPLALRHADGYVRPHLALVGNAAHTIHPLAGQGLNIGVLDAAALAEVVRAAHAAHHDVGAFKTLRRYERWRKGDNLAVMAAMDGFKRLFGSAVAPVRWLRNAGLRLTDLSGPVKRRMVRRAMGLEGDLPALARNEGPRATGS